MLVYVSADGDNIGREVGRASLADEEEEIRKISQRIDAGNRVIESWVITNGGELISYGGDEIRFKIPGDKLGDLPKIREQYAGAVGSTVSVGVGMKVSEADKALLAAKLQGKDRIVLYTPEVDEVIAKLQQPQDEAGKLAEEYLNKSQPGANHGAGAGFAGHSQPGKPKVDAPQQGAEEHSQGEAAQAAADMAPTAPEATHSADGLEEFHQAAQAQQAQKGQQAPGSDQDQLRAQVVQTLQNLKAQMPILEQVKSTAPDTYQAVMGLAQAVVMMARQMNGDNPTQMGAKEMQDRAQSDAQVEVPLSPEEQKAEGESTKDSGDNTNSGGDTKKAEKTYKLEGDALIEVDPKTGKSLGKGPVNKEALEKEELKDRKPEDFDPKDLIEGVNYELDHHEEPHEALGVVMENLSKDPEHYKKLKREKESMEKASLSPNAGQHVAQHHHLNLPVGSQKDTSAEGTKDGGKVKVLHSDTGKQGWVEVRAGQVMSQDGHAISSRNPGGR